MPGVQRKFVSDVGPHFFFVLGCQMANDRLELTTLAMYGSYFLSSADAACRNRESCPGLRLDSNLLGGHSIQTCLVDHKRVTHVT